MSTLTLSGIKKRFDTHQIIHGVDLEIDEGEFVVLVGPSGCGKSTLLRIIAGLDDATEGAIAIGGRDVTNVAPSKRDVAMVFQSYALYPHMTVRQNLTFGMRMRKVDADVIRAKLARAVSILQLQSYLDRKPGELSGGQCQRVAIGRALVQEPAIFLFDEPLSNLDAELRLRMRIEISALHKELKKTMVYVTHDQTEAMTLADKMVVLRNGVVEQVGPPLSLYTNPCNAFVAGFIGSPAMNMIEGNCRLAEHIGIITLPGGAQLQCEVGPAAAPGPCVVGVRPEHWEVANDGLIEAKVTVLERLGTNSFIHAKFAEQHICIETRDTSPPRPGDTVRVSPSTGKIYLFDGKGRTVSAPKYQTGRA